MSAGFSQNQRSTGGHRPPLQQTKTALRQFCSTPPNLGGESSPIKPDVLEPFAQNFLIEFSDARFRHFFYKNDFVGQPPLREL